MIEIENFQDHLKTLKPEDWKKLFDLLPEIEKAITFGTVKGGESLDDGSMVMHHWDSSEIVDKTIKVINELNLYPVFDWVGWDEGIAILNNDNFDYSAMDTITLCKLLTTIIRADRFNDGFTVSCFKKGIMTNIIKGLQKNISK